MPRGPANGVQFSRLTDGDDKRTIVSPNYGGPGTLAHCETRNRKSQHDVTRKIGERQSGINPGGTVGCDVPDESKEHHTEIAVESGRTGGEHRDNKR